MRYFIANTKMNQTPQEAEKFIKLFLKQYKKRKGDTVILCPSFFAIPVVAKYITKNSGVSLGAQNTFWDIKGNYTGEVSPKVLKSQGVKFCIVGHSDRRRFLSETDSMVQKKVSVLVRLGITPILCIGETVEERRKGETNKKISTQVRIGLLKIPSNKHVIVAYEPIWAISSDGKGKNIHPSIIKKEIIFLKKSLARFKNASILYGGSVSPSSIQAIMDMPEIDGVLVGNASLKVSTWLGVYTNAGTL